MEQRHPYTATSVPKSEPQPGPSRWVFTGSAGEQLVIKDHGGCLNVYVDGKDVGYLTYMEEREEGRRRMRLSYIHITNPVWQGKKLSAGLVLALCMKARQKGIDVICVGHPDANIKAYWEAMGFDYQTAQAKQYAINLRNKDNIPEDTPEEYRVRTLAPLQDTVPTEADGPVHALLAWAQRSFLSYWK